MRRLFVFSVLCVVMSGFFLCGVGNNLVFGADQPVELKFISPYYEQHLVHKYTYKPWIDKVAELSGGKMKIAFFAPNSIVKMSEVLEGAKSGLVDIGSSLCGENRGKFPLSDMLEMPLLFPSATAASLTLWDLYNKYPDFKQEYKDVKVVWLWMSAITQVLTSKKPVKTLEDMKGLKIGGHAKGMLDAVQALGAQPVHVAPPEMYMALDRGVIDGALMSFVGARGVKVFEATKYVTKADVQAVSFFSVMNPKRYNALPSDLKKILDDTTGARMARACGEALDRADAETITEVKAKGVTVFELSPQEKERWVKAIMPVREGVLKDVEAKGYKNAREIANEAIKLSKEYGKK